MILRHAGHFSHMPSVRTRRSSGGTGDWMESLSRLNQAIRKNEKKISKKGKSRRARPRKAGPAATSIVYPALGQNALRVRMFHLAHFGHQVGQLHELGMRVA